MNLSDYSIEQLESEIRRRPQAVIQERLFDEGLEIQERLFDEGLELHLRRAPGEDVGGGRRPQRRRHLEVDP